MALADSTARKQVAEPAPLYRSAPHNIEAEQALLVVDAHHGVEIADVVNPGDVLVADPLDGVPAVAVPRERRALDRLESDDARAEALLERIAGGVELFLTAGVVAAMNVLNVLPRSPR